MPAWFAQDYDELGCYRSADLDLADEAQVQKASEEWREGATICLFAVVGKSRDNTSRAYETNLKIAENTGNAANRRKAAHLIFTSSVDVYGIDPINPVSEGSPVKPDSWYSKAKLASEKLLSSKLEPAVKLGVFRCPGIFDLSSLDRSVIGHFYRTASAGKTIELRNGGRNLRDFCHAHDFYNLCKKWLKNPSNCLANAVSGHSFSMRQVAEMIVNKVGQGSIRNQGEDLRDFDLSFDATQLKLRYSQNPIKTLDAALLQNAASCLP